ncbi:MAG: hypothetical protein R3D85_15255 [Paracoccaceae bacterium]
MLAEHTGFHRDVFCSSRAGRLQGLLINHPPEETLDASGTGSGPLSFDLQGKAAQKTGKQAHPLVISS